MTATTTTTTPPPRTFALGGDLLVDRLGFGAMRLTGQPGTFGPFPDWRAGLASSAAPPSSA